MRQQAFSETVIGRKLFMIHDVSHCADYKPDECPLNCYRAQVTEDLKKRSDLQDIPQTWAKFYGTPYCALTRKKK